jgi:HSP20 family protein
MLTDYIIKSLEPSWELNSRHSSHFGEFPARTIHMDIKETESQYEVIADLPGVTKDQAKLDVKDHVLTISYEQKQESKCEGATYHRMERFQGIASRSIRLPRDVDDDKVEATMLDGVLRVTIAKVPKVEPKSIAIK